jgi:hypothetical protein
LLLVTCGSCARPVSFNASDLTADPGWDAARATWYGAPTGAGPDDDGTYTNNGASMVSLCMPPAVQWCIALF